LPVPSTQNTEHILVYNKDCSVSYLSMYNNNNNNKEFTVFLDWKQYTNFLHSVNIVTE